ncbi:MAG: GrpB family protein [Candidatus Dormibacteria bacterium]
MGRSDQPLGRSDTSEELGSELQARLSQLGIPDWPTGPGAATASQVWLQLFRRFGRRINLVDRYRLEATALGVSVVDLTPADRDRMVEQVLPQQFPGWIRETEPTRINELIVVIPYDTHWPSLFANWESRVRDSLGVAALRVDHVGSTSVPGLEAKPVIDIQISVQNLEDEAGYAPQLSSLGAPLRTRDSLHQFFCPPPHRPRTVQFHVCPKGSAWEREHLLFRDYLRTHSDVRRSYGELKRELAVIWRDDRAAYADAKTGFVLDALTSAEKWATTTGWRLTQSGV